MINGPITFPNWKEVLAQASISPQLRAAYVREILTFLKYCKTSRAPATTDLAKQYLEWREKQSAGPAREALRWFYREGRKAGALETNRAHTRTKEHHAAGLIGPPPSAGTLPDFRRSSRPMEPPPAANDLGSEPWEKDLIKAIRERGYLWRTEQTYREWAVRFARFIAPRSPYVVVGEDVAAFLSARRSRAGPVRRPRSRP